MTDINILSNVYHCSMPAILLVAWRHKAKLRAAGKINTFKGKLEEIEWDKD